MKILVLMPCDEKLVNYATAIEDKLPNYLKEKTFSMPSFMDYLVTTHVVENWVMAYFYAEVAMESIYKAAVEKKEDLIIFGNAPKDFKFDVIFNFQDAEETLPYEDKFLDKIEEIVKSEENLNKRIANRYAAKDSIFSLQNCGATAKFLTDYIKTDPHLDDIKEKYREKLKLKDGEEDGVSSWKN